MNSIGDFIYEYKKRNPNGHYFDSETLKFFGERVSEMRLIKGTFQEVDICGNPHTCHAVSILQRKHPYGARRVWKYFDTETLHDVVLKS